MRHGKFSHYLSATLLVLLLGAGGCVNSFIPYDNDAPLEKGQLVFFGKIRFLIADDFSPDAQIGTDVRRYTSKEQFDKAAEEGVQGRLFTWPADEYFYFQAENIPLYFYSLHTFWVKNVGSVGTQSIMVNNYHQFPLKLRMDFKPGMEAVYIGDLNFVYNESKNALEYKRTDNFNAARKEFEGKFGTKLKISQIKPVYEKELYAIDQR